MTPIVLEIAFNNTMEYIYNNNAKVAGRVTTGMTVTQLLAINPYTAALGPILSLAAINGDIRYAIEVGLDKVEGLEKAILGGDVLGIPPRDNSECKCE